MEKPLIVAAFDFDGTLTVGDSLIHFLRFAEGNFKTALKLTLVLPSILAFLVKMKTRQETKEFVLKTFFKGVPIKRMEQLGSEFAVHYLLHRILIPKALSRLKWHQNQGHLCVLISANLEVYLKPWGKLNGFEMILASQLETDEQGLVTGQLIGKNCWGEEKVKRLEKLLGPKDKYTLYAYGDSRGDKELLELADYPFFNEMPETEGTKGTEGT